MTEMQEYWANTYAGGKMGALFSQKAIAYGFTMIDGSPIIQRNHIRMKPKGAPKLYSSQSNRYAWETYPETCRLMVQTGATAENITMLGLESL